jgi:hypothetical protein
MAAALLAAIASLALPITWAHYARYLIARFGWPLVAALVTAVGITITGLFAAKRRKTSGIVAASMFISVVLHMLIVSMFDLMVIRNSMVPFAVRETRREVSFSVPPLAESMVSQELRAQFTPVTMPDPRRFTPDRKPRTEPVEKRPAKPQPVLKSKELPEPAPQRTQPVSASKTKPVPTEALSTLPVKAPDPTPAKLIVPKPLRDSRDAPQPPSPSSRDLLAAPRSRVADQPTERPEERPSATLKDVRRDLLREQMPVAAPSPSRPALKEILRDKSLSASADTVDLPVAQTAAAGAPAPDPGHTEGKAAVPPVKSASQVLDLSGEAAAARSFAGAPSSKDPPANPAARPSITGIAKTESGRFTERVPARDEPSPSPKDQTAREGALQPRALMDAVRIQDRAAVMSAQAAASPDQRPAHLARETLRTDRSERPSLEETTAKSQPKAQLDLAVQPAVTTMFVANRRDAAHPTPAGRPDVREQLATGARPGSVSHPTVEVGRNVEAPRSVTEAPARADAAPSSDRWGSQPPSKAKAAAQGPADMPAAPSFSSHPSTWTTLSSARPDAGREPSGSDPAVREATAFSRMPAVQEVFGGVDGGLAGRTRPGQSPGAGIHLEFAPANPGTLASSLPLQPGNPAPGGRQDLPMAKSQGGVGQPEARPAAPALPSGGQSGSAAQHSMVDRNAFMLSGGSARPAAAVEGALSADDATARQTPPPLTTLVPGMAKAVPDNRPGSESESGGTAAGRHQADVQIAKATGTLDSGSERPPLRMAARTTGREVDSGGTEDSALTVPAPSSGGVRTHGPDEHSLTTVAATSSTSRQPMALPFSNPQSASAAGGSVERPSTASGPSALAEVRVGKAGGGTVQDSVSDGADPVVDASGLSLSASRPPARMDWATTHGSAARTDVRADLSPGNGPATTERVLISAESSAVPESVPEKAIYTLRSPERRRAFIGELGGSPQTEQAVEQALVWLANAQSDDGRWDVNAFKTVAQCGGPGDREDGDVGLTGLCLLSYLGAGYTHVKGLHKETVRKALNWLVIGQKTDGDLQRSGQMYGQAMATAALCEGYSMTGDPRLREPVERAVAFILKAQNPGAGWRYLPRQDSDTSVTGWQVLALKSAMIAGISFPPEHFAWVETWLDSVRRGQEGGLYTYMPGHGATPTMTAEGWFCQLLMREQTRLRGQAETIPFLMAHPPVWSPKDRTVNLYYWYYATLALHLSGAPEFKQWNQALTQALLTGQVRGGPAAGSWDPVCVLGDRGGRVYSTVTAALCLEVYYRYLPFYKQK